MTNVQEKGIPPAVHDRPVTVASARRLARRSLFRAAAVQGVAVVAAAGPARAVLAAGTQARPAAGRTRTVIVFSPVPWGTPQERAALYGTILRPFLDQNPGVDVKLSFQARGDFGTTSANILAGTSPDVFEDYQIGGQLMEGGFLLDLTPYITRSNSNLAVFPQAQIQYFNLAGHQYALPVSIESVVCAVNTGVLADLGLSMPPEDWNYLQAEALFRKTARLTGNPATQRYGGAFYFYYPYIPDEYYLNQFGGSYVDPANPARCNLAAPGSIAAGEYLYPLLQDNVCTLNWATGKLFNTGQLVVCPAGTWMLPQFAETPGSVSWQFLPMPAGPTAAATFGSPAFYGIPRTSKVADAAWSLLEWMSFSSPLQVANMKFGLLPPARIDLYADWISVVMQAAPPLRHVNLAAFTYTENHDIDPYFKYNTLTAFSDMNTWGKQVMTNKMPVRQAFSQAAKQVDAYEAQGTTKGSAG